MDYNEKNYALTAALIKGAGIIYMVSGVIIGLIMIFAEIIWGGLLAGMAIAGVGKLIHMGGEAYARKHGVSSDEAKDGAEGAKKFFKTFACIFIPVFAVAVIIMAINMSPNKGATTKTNTCGYCERSWEAGDPGGNYKNIARTNLCKICEANYKDLKQFLD